MSLQHWINDGLMALFFLLVGLEIKREVLDGQLSSWRQRVLPGIAAAGGMIVPALVYLSFNSGVAVQGWAIPTATDIAFALGVIALLGKRVPMSLRIFLTALAIIDDLGAVLIIALVYTVKLSLIDLAGAAMLAALLFGLNRMRVRHLLPYLVIGALLWVLVLRSGIHATLAGVILAFAIPLEATPGHPDAEEHSPLHRLEHALHLPVGFIVLPVFGLANAGVSFINLPAAAFLAAPSIGVGLGLLAGKAIGVFGASALAIRFGLADQPAHSNNWQMAGVALLCGIGFTMSLFITLLAFPTLPELQVEAKIGILGGSIISGLLGYFILRTGGMRPLSNI